MSISVTLTLRLPAEEVGYDLVTEMEGELGDLLMYEQEDPDEGIVEVKGPDEVEDGLVVRFRVRALEHAVRVVQNLWGTVGPMPVSLELKDEPAVNGATPGPAAAALGPTAPTPTDDLDGRLADPDWHVRWDAAQDPALTAEQIRRIVDGPDRDLRWSLAQRGDALPHAVLIELAQDADASVREQVASRTSDPVALEILARDTKVQIRAIAASTTRDPDLLAALATDRSYRVRLTVALRRSPSAHLHEQLAQDSHPEVRDAALSRLRGE